MSDSFYYIKFFLGVSINSSVHKMLVSGLGKLFLAHYSLTEKEVRGNDIKF